MCSVLKFFVEFAFFSHIFGQILLKLAYGYVLNKKYAFNALK